MSVKSHLIREQVYVIIRVWLLLQTGLTELKCFRDWVKKKFVGNFRIRITRSCQYRYTLTVKVINLFKNVKWPACVELLKKQEVCVE